MESIAALVKDRLDASDARLALVARSGTDLSRFGLRYSHAGVSLKASSNAPWSVRQLYYACDERRPRLFDQGLSGLLGDLADRKLLDQTLVVTGAVAKAGPQAISTNPLSVVEALGSAGIDTNNADLSAEHTILSNFC